MLKSGSTQCIPNVDPRKIATTFTALFTEEFLLSAIQMVLKMQNRLQGFEPFSLSQTSNQICPQTLC